MTALGMCLSSKKPELAENLPGTLLPADAQ
jgi:hypothetical protein